MPDALERLGQLLLRFIGPFGKCGQKTIELEGEKFLGFLEAALFSPREFAELPHRLETHLGVAHFGNELADFAQAFVLPLPKIVTYFAMDQAQRGPRLFQMLARFVHGGAFPVLLGPARFDRAFDLVTDDSLNAVADRFVLPQLVALILDSRYLRASATLLYFALPVTSRPIQSGRLERRAAFLIVEFHFGHDQAAVPPAVNIDLDRVSFPRHFVADLGQPAAHRRRPERIKLLHAQPDLPLFARAFRPLLEGERADRAFLAQTHLEAARSDREIALRDRVVRKFLESGRKPFQEKFPFDLPRRLLFRRAHSCGSYFREREKHLRGFVLFSVPSDRNRQNLSCDNSVARHLARWVEWASRRVLNSNVLEACRQDAYRADRLRRLCYRRSFFGLRQLGAEFTRLSLGHYPNMTRLGVNISNSTTS